ncbi:MAG: hypothetical protein LQ337_006809 [Flavoplaca oasis]|nr:MAG: hypothetical protein LQ337_006809 [Flavoplaca oasis]
MHALSSRRGLARLRNVSYKSVLQFSTSTPNWKTSPRRSPTVQANQRARQQGLPPPPPPEKWPTGRLEHCIQNINELAPVNLKDVTAILDDFDALGLSMAKMQAKTICSEYNIEPTALSLLGVILLNHNDFKYREVATTLLVCGLDSGHPQAIHEAATRLLNDVIFTGRQKGPGVAAARRIAQERAKRNNAQYVALEGKMLEYEGKPLQALQLYQQWSDLETEHRKRARMDRMAPWTIAQTPERGDICKALARLRAKLGDRTGAEEAIRDAALVYDDPAAYYHLAVEFVTPDSEEYETYLLKAASSDEPKASHELGMLYFNQSRQGIPLHEPKESETIRGKDSRKDMQTPSDRPLEQQLSRQAMLDKRAEAMEWFNIAAQSGIVASQIYLALLLREAGRAEDGLQWLQVATKSNDADDWTEAVEYFKRIWRLSAPDPMLMNIESLRKSYRNQKKKGESKLASLADATWITDSYLHMKKFNGEWCLDELGSRVLEKHRARKAVSWT